MILLPPYATRSDTPLPCTWFSRSVGAEEQARLACGGVARGVDARLRHVAGDAVAERGDPLRPEHPAQRHRAVAPERIDRRRIQCRALPDRHLESPLAKIGRASCRERVCQYV